jgi:hypothetical protein
VGVAAEDTLVVHDVQGLTLVRVLLLFEEDIGGCGRLVLGFLSEDLGLGSFESLLHLFILIKWPLRCPQTRYLS